MKMTSQKYKKITILDMGTFLNIKISYQENVNHFPKKIGRCDPFLN